MKQVLAKGQIERELTNRFGSVFKIGAKPSADFLSSGVSEIDTLTGGGMPRGAITELCGPTSSGRISTLVAALACATSNNEICALVDTMDSFDLSSAAKAGVDLNRLLWVRCSSNLERAFKATDLLLQSGGFGLVALNLADVTARYTRQIVSSWWFRFRRAIKSTPTVLAVITPVTSVRSCAAMLLETKSEGALWSGSASLSMDASGDGKPGQQSTNRHQLSLVAKSACDSYQYSLLTHSHLLNGLDVRVNLAKPALWTQCPAKVYRVINTV